MDLVNSLRALFSNLPGNNILDANAATENYGNSTFSSQVNIDAAVIVESKQQISDVLKFANENNVTLYPIGSGKNWGYGSVSEEKCINKVVLDLSKLNKIIPTCKQSGLVTLEPGVTQSQLFNFLLENEWPYLTPVTGAGPSAGIVSNAMESGYGITPYSDHFDAVTSLKFLIPHPDFCMNEVSSAISELDFSGDDMVDKTYKHGMGPVLQGLAVQSNLMIVTEMTIKLKKKTEAFSAFYLQFNKKGKFTDLVKSIQTILQDLEGIVGSINLMDRRRLLSMTSENPNGKDQHMVMSHSQVKMLAKQQRTPEWLVVGTIYGRNGIVKEAKKIVKKEFRNFGNCIFTDSNMIQAIKKAANTVPLGPLLAVKSQFKTLDLGEQIMQGSPNEVALPLAYWRNPRISNLENRSLRPDKDGCGLLWYAPLLPFDPIKINECVEMVREITPEFGIEPMITFTNLNHHSIDATIPIVFDNQSPEYRQKALACLDKLVEIGLKKGFVPYRLNSRQQQQLLDPAKSFWRIVNMIKSELDPNGILSRGRYNPIQQHTNTART